MAVFEFFLKVTDLLANQEIKQPITMPVFVATFTCKTTLRKGGTRVVHTILFTLGNQKILCPVNGSGTSNTLVNLSLMRLECTVKSKNKTKFFAHDNIS